MVNTEYNLIQLHTLFTEKNITSLSDNEALLMLDNMYDVSLIQLLTHEDKQYFSVSNNATNLNESFWVTDDSHIIGIDPTTNNVTTEETTTVDVSGVDYFLSTEETTTDNLDINAIADLCSDLSSNQILELIGKLSKIAVKNSKSENKKAKVNKPEKTQTTSNKRVSDKNFNYFNLLSNWYNSALSAREIAADPDLSQGYGAATIGEDMRVVKVLLGGDKLVQVSQDWCDYIINYWSENSDTTWQRLHYAFAKDGRKCDDLDILCNYVIDSGVTKEDVKNAIASQN